MRQPCRGVSLQLSLAATALTLLASAAEARTILTFACHYNNAQKAIIERQIEAYERANPEVDVVYQQVSHRDYLQTMLTARIGGQSPDIYNLHMDWAPRLIEGGVLAEPPPALAERVRRDYLPAAVTAATIDGKLWGVPGEISNYLLAYNRQHLAEAGFEAPPATWEELLRMAGATTRRGADGKPVRFGYGYGDTPASLSQPYLSLLVSLGGDVLDPARAASALGSPEAVRALELYREPARLGLADPAVPVFDQPGGTVAMGIVASWRRSTYAEVMGPGFTDVIGVAPVPMGPDWRTLHYAFFMTVDAGSPNAAEAWRFVDWMNAQAEPGKSSPVGDVLADLGGLTGSRPDIAAHPEVYEDPFTKPFVDALARSQAMANVAASEEIKSILHRAVEKAVWGGIAPADALNEASAEVDAALAGG